MTSKAAANINFLSLQLIFAAYLVGSSIVIGLCRMLMNVNLAGVSIALPLLSAMFVAEHFVKQHERVPVDLERKRLAWGGVVTTLVVNGVLMTIAWALGAADGLPGEHRMTILAIAVGFIPLHALVCYPFLLWAYGGWARKQLARIEKRKARRQAGAA